MLINYGGGQPLLMNKARTWLIGSSWWLIIDDDDWFKVIDLKIFQYSSHSDFDFCPCWWRKRWWIVFSFYLEFPYKAEKCVGICSRSLLWNQSMYWNHKTWFPRPNKHSVLYPNSEITKQGDIQPEYKSCGFLLFLFLKQWYFRSQTTRLKSDRVQCTIRNSHHQALNLSCLKPGLGWKS